METRENWQHRESEAEIGNYSTCPSSSHGRYSDGGDGARRSENSLGAWVQGVHGSYHEQRVVSGHKRCVSEEMAVYILRHETAAVRAPG